MNTRLRLSFLLLFTFALSVRVSAQLTGTITVPGSTYLDLTSVITALNTQGVGAGGVTINLLPGNPQVPPAGGYLLGGTTLNQSVSSTKTITINGNGNTVSAYVGTGSVDGIFFIRGTDYVTINGLNLLESVANATPTNMMEWGYALVKLNATGASDGCQNVTIKNCTISLSNANTAAIAAGIYLGNHVYNNTTALTPLTAADANSNNTFMNDTVRNVRTCISLNGYADPAYALYDQNNSVGGALTTQGNALLNFGYNNGSTAYGVYMNKQKNVIVQNNYVNDSVAGGYQNAGPVFGIFDSATINTTFTCTGNTIQLVNNSGSSVVAGIHSGVRGASASVTISNNVLQNFYYGTASTANTYFIWQNGVARNVTVSNNQIANSTNLAKNGPSSAIYGLKCEFGFAAINGNDTYSDLNITGNTMNNVSKASSSTAGYLCFYDFNAFNTIRGHQVITNNTVSNLYNVATTSGYGFVSGIYSETGGGNGDIFQSYVYDHNTISNLTSSSTANGIFINSGDSVTISNNSVSGIIGGGTTTGINFGRTGTGYAAKSFIYNNNVSNISSTSANPGNPVVYGLIANGGINYIYNNIVSIPSATAVSSYPNPVMGLSLVGNNTGITGKKNYVYNNTINIGGTNGISGSGATGIHYWTSDSNTIMNNIVYVNANGGSGAGYNVAAIRRDDTSLGGAPPTLIAFTANNNIYYTQSGPKNFLYVEGTADAMLRNGFATSGLTNLTAKNIVNDPQFNTACSLYKSFMLQNRETATFTENNLSIIGVTNTYAPTTASYAKNLAVPVTAPAITTDYNGVTRTSTPDAGALQFTGTAIGGIPPIITYTTTPPTTTYCPAAPVSVSANITAVGGPNTTTGAPRLYYKKSSEQNAFSATNTSAFNGWKYVNGTAAGSVFTFTINYGLLTAAPVVGDSITYFIIAQDNSTSPAIAINTAGFAVGCGLPGVNLSSAAGILSTPISNGYKILTVPSNWAAVASQNDYCSSGIAYMSQSPALPGTVSLQWQHDNHTGNWVDVSSATGATYTSGTLTTSDNYRVQVRCAGSAAISSAAAPINIYASSSAPTGTPGTRCGTGSATLSATGGTGAKMIWYDSLTGGSVLDTGATFHTPIISTNTNYYVSAYTGLINGTVGEKGYHPNAYWRHGGQTFNALAAFDLLSVDVFPMVYAYNQHITTFGTVTIKLLDGANNVLKTIVTNNIAFTDTPGIRTTIPINYHVPQGNNYKLVLQYLSGTTLKIDSTSGTIKTVTYTKVLGCNYFTGKHPSYPYVQQGVMSITNQVSDYNVFPNVDTIFTISNTGTDEWSYFYNWKISSGCQSARVAVPASVTPAVPVTAQASPNPICGPGQVTLTATSSNTNYSYTWAPGGQTGSSVTVNVLDTINYVVTALDNTSGGNACTATDTVQVVVKPKPTATFTPTGATAFCKGDSVELDATSTFTTIQWQLNGVDIPGATGPIYNAKDSGVYTIVISNGICSATSPGITISVTSVPAPHITSSGNTMSVPNNYSAYQWYLNGQPITGATSSSYTGTAGGVYSVKVTNAFGCSVTTNQITLGINSVYGAQSIRIYPNPATTVVHIDASIPVNVSLNAMDGKELLQRNAVKDIDISQYADGVYMLRITDENGQFIRNEKIVKASK